MREHKRAAIPSGDLISLGSKSKKVSLAHGNPVKKVKSQSIEVDPSELVTRVEAAVSTNDNNLADSLIIAALNQLKTASGHGNLSTSLSSGSDFRPASSGSSSRLLPGVSLGLLVLVQDHPNLFTRPTVLDHLILILSLSPRELGISLPSTAITTIMARIRGLHVLIANILYLALNSQAKWPSKLIKVYLEDSLTNRVWVDQDECRLFVLNLETAFPKTFGDPRGLFTVLSSHQNGSVGANQASGTINYSTSATSGNAVLNVLGFAGIQPSTSSDPSVSIPLHCEKDEISEAVSDVLKNQNNAVSRAIYGSDMNSHVSPRFEACRQAVEVIIINTLRDALGRRSGTTPSSSQTNTATSNTPSSSVISSSSSTSITGGDATQLRNLLRTLGMAVAIAEVRGLVATRMEPWLTNPKLQLYGLGLFALVATNCRLGGLSPHDLDIMISSVYRIRYKLLKPNIQTAFLECISHLVKAAPMNLYCLVNLSSAASELRFASSASESGQTNQNLSTVVMKVAETVQAFSTESGSSTGSAVIAQQNSLNSAAIASVAANATSASSRGSSSAGILLPFLYQRFGSHWIRIIGDLLNERLILTSLATAAQASQNSLTESQLFVEFNSRLSPIYQFLRELARFTRSDNDRSVSGSPLVSQNNLLQSQQNYLPCAELAFALLQDRSFRGTTSASTAVNAIVASLTQQRDHLQGKTSTEHTKTDITIFQCYLHGLMGLLCALQMLSANRPFLSNTSSTTARRTSSFAEATKTHHLTIRQIRLAFVRWTKSLLPMFINAASQSCSLPSTKCIEIIKPVNLIRRVFILDSVAVLNESQSESGYQLTSSLYPVQDIWPDQDQNSLSRLICDTGVSEKLLNQLLILGLDSSWQCLNAVDAGDIVCNLIWRCAMFSCDSGLEGLTITRPEQLFDLLFASCTYLSDQQIPAELSELAYANIYWKVTLTCMILAAYCPRTCGAYLWSNYPTVRRLMEIVISSDLVNGLKQSSTDHDHGVEVTEKLNYEIEVQLILRLESFLLSNEVTPETSKLIGKMVRNNPRGPCRRLPDEQLHCLRALCERLHLERRLWSSRSPDFLLDLLRSQANSVVAQPWLMRLVESTGQDLDVLPVQCLCEYLLYDAMTRVQTYKTDWSYQSKNLIQSMNIDDIFNSLPSYNPESLKLKETNKLISHLVAKLQEKLTLNSFDYSVSDAFTHSFFSRLSDSRRVVRQAARQCMRSLVPEAVNDSPGQELTDTASRWLYILEYFNQLSVLNSDNKSESLNSHVLKEQLTGPILTSFQVENDLDILSAHLVFLKQMTYSPSFTSWQTLVTGLSQFIRTRRTIVSNLLHRHTSQCHDSLNLISKTAYTVLEAMAEIFTRYVNHCCTITEAIPVMEKKSVFVSWSPDCQYPFDIEFIQAQILLLTHLNDDLPEVNSVTGEPSWWIRLRDTWFILSNCRSSSHDNNSVQLYRMPEMSPLACSETLTDVCKKQTGQDIWFTNESSDTIPQLKFSTELRSSLIETNQTPLVYAAFLNMTFMEFNELMKSLPLYVLKKTTITLLSERINSLPTDYQNVKVLSELKEIIVSSNETKSVNLMDVDSPEELTVSAPTCHRIQVGSSILPRKKVSAEKLSSPLSTKETKELDYKMTSSSEKDLVHPIISETDSFGTYGLYELVNILPKNIQLSLTKPILLGADIQYDLILCSVHRLLFERGQFYENYIQNVNLSSFGGNHNYFINELLNQANPVFLRKLVCVLLQYTDTEQIQPVKALNFITALFTLPRLLYPVPRAEPRDRPDAAVALSSVHLLSLVEACKLIEYVLSEAYELVKQNDDKRIVNWDALNKLYSRRIPLLDMAIVQWPKSCILLLEITSGLTDIHTVLSNVNDQLTLHTYLPISLLKNNNIIKCIKSDELWSILAFRLILCLYFRRPGIANLFTSSITRQLICYPHPVNSKFSNLHHFIEKFGLSNQNSSKFSQPEVDRIGPILLVSLTASNMSIMDTAQLAYKALITHHTRAALRLIPIICGLSEGRLGISWAQFTHKRYHLLFSNLLHILEILSTTSMDSSAEMLLDVYANNGSLSAVENGALFSREVLPYSKYVERLLANLIAALASFHENARHLSGFPKRLAKLLQFHAQFAPWSMNFNETVSFLKENQNINDNFDILAEKFEEFIPIPSMLTEVNESYEDKHHYSSSLLSVISKCRGQISKQWNLAVLQPFVYHLRTCIHPEMLCNLLCELEIASKRRISILLHFKSELESLIGHSSETVANLAVQLLLRLLHHYPHLAQTVVTNTIIPYLCTKSHNLNRFSLPILSMLPDVVMLAPYSSPKLMQLCAEHIIFGVPDETTYQAIDYYEVSMRRLTLDGLDGACIEHASSALTNTTSMVRTSLQ
ncbi:unnamed protein product [Trichobilharzia szidati]|nr:unnamed protein product [Trichobilharzia szidati]